MSIAPLPAPLIDRLDRAGRVLDLGCGETTLLDGGKRDGALYVALDRRGPTFGSVANLVADALQPPFRRESFDLVVAAQLFRHIGEPGGAAGILSCWQDLVKPGGALYLFEDEPDLADPACANYVALQAFLARLLPERRRPLLPRSRFEAIIGATDRATGWTLGSAANELKPDPAAVLAMLQGAARDEGGEAARLGRRIAADGLSYGRFWWACWTAAENRRTA